MRYRIGNLAALAWIAGGAVALEAHHSAAPHYDLDKEISLDATITKFEFVNPHGYVYFTVPGKDGKPAPWRCELAARTALERKGWTTAVFTPGHRVTIKGAPARREENVCMLNSFIREDGKEVSRMTDLTQLGAPSPGPMLASAQQIVARSAKFANGRPNLAGTWVSLDGPGGRGGRGGKGPDGKGGFKGPDFAGGKGPGGRGPDAKGKDGKGKDGKAKGPAPEPSDAGLKAAESYDQRFDDPGVHCSPANILFGWTHDQHVNEISQKDDSVTLKYGYMDLVRTVRMNARQPDQAPAHAAKIVPSLAGDSVGHWEGDVLVVDTVAFSAGVLLPLPGILHSDRLHVVERFTVDTATGRLTRTYRAEDPLYLKAPFAGSDSMALSAEPYRPYNCVELSGKNNQRPAVANR